MHMRIMNTNTRASIVSQHTLNKITQRTPEILAASKIMLIDKQNIVLEAGIEMSFETEFANNRVVVAVDMGINAVHAFEYLADHAWEGFGEGNT